jgi:diguanylate cyclase (GGDEF)-like protein/PAS domain S-box-containing protein
VTGLVLVGLVLFAGIAAFALQLSGADQARERAAQRRFEQRAQISAALTQSVFGALGSASSTELARRLGGPPATLRRHLTAMTRRSKLVYAAVLDDRGAVLTTIGAAPARVGVAAPGAKQAIVSDVRSSGAGPAIEYALPFTTAAGRRVLVEALPLAMMRAFLDAYLQRLPNPDGSTLLVSDQRGQVLARIAPPGDAAPARARMRVSVAVPGTTWRLALAADRARVLEGVGGIAWIAWIMLGVLALAVLAGLWLCARLLLSARRGRIGNRALRESESKLRGLVDALEEAVILRYADGRVELLNESARALFGTDADRISYPPAGWTMFDDDGVTIDVDDGPSAMALAGSEPDRRVIGLLPPEGPRIWLEVSTRPLTQPGADAPYAVVCSCTDVTERQELEAHLLDLADRDPLTGLWNRRRFEQDVARQLDRCERYGEQAALVIMDVDGFKQVNDGLGHLTGDEVLRAFADALRARLRGSDLAARLGGDEFAVLLLAVSEAEAAHIADELAADLAAAARIVQHRFELSLSVGTTMLGGGAAGVSEALDAADRAMYAAKQRRQTPAPPRRATTFGTPPQPVVPAEMASLRALLAAVNARDSYTALHSRQVVTLARQVARRLELEEAVVTEVEHVALLHDLGKIAIPDAILRKSGPLSQHEWTLMRQHPIVGAEILASMPELEHLSPAVRAEHERWDGGGYPDGLVAEEIPVASRIALVCDAYHAMTSDRPYRRAMSAAQARDEIRAHAGSQFCPRAAAALLAVLDEQREPAALAR